MALFAFLSLPENMRGLQWNVDAGVGWHDARGVVGGGITIVAPSPRLTDLTVI